TLDAEEAFDATWGIDGHADSVYRVGRERDDGAVAKRLDRQPSTRQVVGHDPGGHTGTDTLVASAARSVSRAASSAASTVAASTASRASAASRAEVARAWAGGGRPSTSIIRAT